MFGDPTKTFAIVFGLEQYHSVPALDGPADDAVDFVEWLLSKGVPLENIVTVASPQLAAEKRVNALRANSQAIFVERCPSQMGNPAVTFQTIRIALQRLQKIVNERDAHLLFVFGSGHGAVIDRETTHLALEDYDERDMQFLEVDNLLAHLRSRDYGYPVHQLLVFDMCSAVIDTRTRNVTPAINRLQVGAINPKCQQETLFAAAIGAAVGFDVQARRSSFWLRLSQLLASDSAANFPYVRRIGGEFLSARWSTHNVLRGDISGSTEFVAAGRSDRTVRGIVTATLAVVVVSMVIITAAWQVWQNARQTTIGGHLLAIQHAPDADALAVAVRAAQASWFPTSIRSELSTRQDIEHSKRVAALLFWDRDESIKTCEAGQAQTDLVHYLCNTNNEIATIEQWLLTSLKQVSAQGSDRAYCMGITLAQILNKAENRSKVSAASLESITKYYKSHPDPGVHSALGLILRRANHDVVRLDRELVTVRSESQVLEQLTKGETDAPTWFVTTGGTTMVVVPPGSFVTSKPQSWKDTNNAVAIGSVSVRKWFAIATTEVTNDEFSRFAVEYAVQERRSIEELFPKRTTGGLQSERWLESGEVAATRISWTDAMNYCEWLQGKSGVAHNDDPLTPNSNVNSVTDTRSFRLPMESEWELACRAESTTNYFFGDDAKWLVSFAQFGTQVENKDDGCVPQRVALKLPNRYGLFDLYGNSEEWCINYWRDDITGGDWSAWKPAGSAESPARPLRGSSAGGGGSTLFSSFRQSQGEKDGQRYSGFRIAKSIHAPR